MAFEKIRGLLSCAPVLRLPNFDRQFIIHVDASDIGAGAVLLQKCDDDVLHPICYFSVKFKKHQRSYATIAKEALGVLFAIEKFEVYISGSPFPVIIYTDHNPLQFVHRMRNKNQRLFRWSLAQQPHNIEIKHISGRENVIADILSRDFSKI